MDSQQPPPPQMQMHSIKPGMAQSMRDGDVGMAGSLMGGSNAPAVAIQGSIGEVYGGPAQNTEAGSLNTVSRELDSFLQTRLGNKKGVDAIMQMNSFIGKGRHPKPPGGADSQKASSARSPRFPQKYNSMMNSRKQQLSYDETKGKAQQVSTSIFFFFAEMPPLQSPFFFTVLQYKDWVQESASMQLPSL